ncbi:MAG: GTPase HflX [Candidatus Coatesbacteria bacterium]
MIAVSAFEGPAPAALTDLEELEELIRSAGAEVVDRMVQRRRDGGPLLGEGKVRELAALVKSSGAAVVVTQQSLSPSQQRRLEEGLPCRVVDRTSLILDIFAQRARSREGQLQVELAQLLYRLPRLRGEGVLMSRQAGRAGAQGAAGGAGAGGLGTRGPGEQKLEYDRRRIRERESRLKREIESLRRRRSGQREHRHDRAWPLVTLAGYTNAGKSTLFNALTRAGAVAQGRMFSTLDPQVRQVRCPAGGRALLTDTVGFIRDLPKDLRVAFRATLEEIGQADAVLHVVDASHPDAARQAAAVLAELETLGVAPDAVLTVLNKIDRLEDHGATARLSVDLPAPPLLASARSGDGLDRLGDALEEVLRRRFWQHLPFRNPAPRLRARLSASGASMKESRPDRNGLVTVDAWVAPALVSRLKAEGDDR